MFSPRGKRSRRVGFFLLDFFLALCFGGRKEERGGPRIGEDLPRLFLIVFWASVIVSRSNPASKS